VLPDTDMSVFDSAYEPLISRVVHCNVVTYDSSYCQFRKMVFRCAVCERTFHSRNGRRHHMIIEHRVQYDRSGRNLETAVDEDLDAVRRSQQHRRHRRRGTVGRQAQSMAQLHRQSGPPPPEADPDVAVINSDDEEGAALREDLAQFMSTWVHRWPSRSARSLIDEFVDVSAEYWERLRDLVAAGVESECRLAEAILAEASQVFRRRGTVGDVYSALHSLLLAAVNRPLH